ncbi:MAG: hypothetical protein ACE5WD_08405 [Candidatus Aminicenantia bacterium]
MDEAFQVVTKVLFLFLFSAIPFCGQRGVQKALLLDFHHSVLLACWLTVYLDKVHYHGVIFCTWW